MTGGPYPHPAPRPAIVAALAAVLADRRVQAARPRFDPGRGWRVAVTPASGWLATERALRREALGVRLQRRWCMTYDAAYHAGGAARAPDFTTWTSSLTRAPMAEGAMRVWLDATLARLRALPHRRTLDLGCGAGLVLAELAPECQGYLGLDTSAEAISGLEAWVRSRPALRHVRLLHRPAHILDDLPEGSFDLVVLNSVVQYFPDVEHLLLVLRAAVRCLAPGGRIVLGDLRVASLLPLHARVVAAGRTPLPAGLDELRVRANEILAAGRELALDPGLLPALKPLLSRLSDVRFGLKPAATDPELAGYRYDAVLEFDGEASAPATSVSWDALVQSHGRNLMHHLAARLRAGEALALLGVPNARLPPAFVPGQRPGVVAEIADGIAPEDGATRDVGLGAFEPEVLAAALGRLGISTELRPASGCPDGRFDVLLWRPGRDARRPAWSTHFLKQPVASDPLGAELLDDLRRALQQVVHVPGVDAEDEGVEIVIDD